MSPRPLAVAAAIAAIASLGSPAGARADESWTVVQEKGGVVIERRAVPGSRFAEHRGRARSSLSAARVFATLWTDRPDGPTARRYRKKRVVLRESDTEKVVYEQVKAPVVSDRDYTVVFRRFREGEAYRFEFHIDNTLGPPPERGFVRMERLRGEWTVTPVEGGGCDIEYRVHNEPGGDIPAWIVKGPQVDSVRDLVREILDYASRRAEP